MNEGLRRYSSIGNKDGILLLCGKVLTGKVENIPSVKASCSFIDEVDLNVNCGLVTLVELGLLKIDGDDCIGDVLDRFIHGKGAVYHPIKLPLLQLSN